MKTLWAMAAGMALVFGSGLLRARAQQPTWELSVRPARDAAIFDPGETPQLTAQVRNVSTENPQAVLRFEVTDCDGRVLNSGRAEVTADLGQQTSVILTLGEPAKLPHEEYLAVKVVLEADGQTQAELRKGFGFLPKRTPVGPPESSPFGLLSDGSWPLLQRLGVRWVRPNWSWAERPMDWARRYGIAYVPLVNAANAFLRGDLTEQEYADFIRESVRRFRHYVRYWQLGNEFDVFHRDGPVAYVESQRIGYAAAKAEDPDCIVVGGSITELQCRRQGWEESLAAGLARYCDIYDFHFYADLKTTQDLLDYIHQTCRRYGAEKPIWVTETTQVPMLDPDDRNQAEYVFKRYAHLLANGVAVVFWHALRWPYPYSVDKVQATALVDYEGFARPGLFAYAALTRELADAKFRRRWRLGEDIYAFEFTRGGEARLVLWTEGKPCTLTAVLKKTTGPSTITATHPSGQRQSFRASGRQVRLETTSSPRIFSLPAHLESLSR
ncbi:MAG: glycosyl hydrolase [Armatimonadetes bacterium]|nr:glycosyl hydrolase [Armatimonadota bacterium]